MELIHMLHIHVTFFYVEILHINAVLKVLPLY